MERSHPVQSTALSSSRTVGIHPVHTFGSKQRHQWLSKFLNCFIECFRWTVSVFTQCFILCQQQTLDCTHQCTTFTGQVRSSFTLESCFEQITRANTDTQCNSTFVSLACCILINCIWWVQTTTFEEHSTQRCTRTFRSDHDNIDIFWRNYTGTIIPGNSKSVREIQCFSSSKMRFDSRPYRDYGCIRKQAHDNSSFLACFFDAEQSFSRNPSVGNSFIVCFALTLSYDDIETIVTQIQWLSRSLHTITDDSYRFIFHYLTCFFQRKLIADYYIFCNTAKIHLCHNTIFLLKIN